MDSDDWTAYWNATWRRKDMSPVPDDRTEEFEVYLARAEEVGGQRLEEVRTLSVQHITRGHAFKQKGCVNCLADDSIPWSITWVEDSTRSTVEDKLIYSHLDMDKNTHWDPGTKVRPHFTLDPKTGTVYSHETTNSSSYISWTS